MLSGLVEGLDREIEPRGQAVMGEPARVVWTRWARGSGGVMYLPPSPLRPPGSWRGLPLTRGTRGGKGDVVSGAPWSQSVGQELGLGDKQEKQPTTNVPEPPSNPEGKPHRQDLFLCLPSHPPARR